MNKAPGMKFVLDVSDEKRKLTPRVIHALGMQYCFLESRLKPRVLVIPRLYYRKYQMGIHGWNEASSSRHYPIQMGQRTRSF